LIEKYTTHPIPNNAQQPQHNSILTDNSEDKPLQASISEKHAQYSSRTYLEHRLNKAVFGLSGIISRFNIRHLCISAEPIASNT
jgi:hypothetical protein